MLKVHLVVGARPNFMKMSPLYDEFSRYPGQFQPSIIHTGQHYDERMSKLFFNDLGMPKPQVFLNVGSGPHGSQTARVMERYEECLLQEKPDIIFVAGDVNSTMACAIDGVKLHIPVAHVEAGLRSFDRRMPEEINRLITDSVADYLLTPSPDGTQNLLREGISPEKIYFVGNIMIDSLMLHSKKAEQSSILRELGLESSQGASPYVMITLHRPSNVDNIGSLSIILNALARLDKSIRLVFPMHPRTKTNLSSFGLNKLVEQIPNLTITEPLGYLDFLKLETHSHLVITDSGGIQEETTYLGIQCLTLRENTERPITVTEGTNRLIPLETSAIITAVHGNLSGNIKSGRIPEKWDGKTAQRIVSLFR